MTNWLDLHPLVQHDIILNIFTIIILYYLCDTSSHPELGENTVCWVSLLDIWIISIAMISWYHIYCDIMAIVMPWPYLYHAGTFQYLCLYIHYRIMTTCPSLCLCLFSRLFEARSRSPRRRSVNVFARKRCADVVCDMMVRSTHKSNQVFNSCFFMGKHY